MRLCIAVAFAVILSQFFRTSLGVIAPELTLDLKLTPEMLGFANACFFISLGVVQVPAGILFDRVGVRKTYLGLTGFAVLGALLHGWVDSGLGLAAARLLLGLGCGAAFMSVVMLSARWFPPDRNATAMSVLFALSQVGILLAATPLAAATAAVGWRPVFVASAAVTVVCGVVYWLFARDDPPGAASAQRRVAVPETSSPVAPLEGYLRVLRTPGVWPVIAIHMFAYAAPATLLGLWAGPYLADVHGLSPVDRGNVMLAMAAAQLIGLLVIGPMDRIFNTRKWIIVAGAASSVAVLGVLALLEKPSLAVAGSLLVLLTLVSNYPVVTFAHARALFPAAIAGRGVTTVNLSQIIGAAVLPWATGGVIGMVATPGTPYPEIAYRLVFATIAAPLFVGLLLYLGVRDVKPSQSAPGQAP
jgi:MFS family permease